MMTACGTCQCIMDSNKNNAKQTAALGVVQNWFADCHQQELTVRHDFLKHIKSSSATGKEIKKYQKIQNQARIIFNAELDNYLLT